MEYRRADCVTLVKSDDLIFVVNALRRSVDGGRWIIDGSVDAAAIKETVVARVWVDISSHTAVIPSNHIAFVVDAFRKGCQRGVWIVEGGEAAACFIKAMCSGAVVEVPYNLARIINTLSKSSRVADGRGIVDSGEGPAALCANR
jgi:hypothetical protein